jgi:hypothetical protein
MKQETKSEGNNQNEGAKSHGEEGPSKMRAERAQKRG